MALGDAEQAVYQSSGRPPQCPESVGALADLLQCLACRQFDQGGQVRQQQDPGAHQGGDA